MATENSAYGVAESLMVSDEITLLRAALQLLRKGSDILLHLGRFAALHYYY